MSLIHGVQGESQKIGNYFVGLNNVDANELYELGREETWFYEW